MNQLLSNKVSIIAFAACTMAAPVAAIADDTAAEPSIVGRWVAFLNGPTTSYSLSTFFPGGQTMEDNSATQLRTASQGEWIKVGPSDYIRSQMFLMFDPPRTFTGLQKITNFIQLNEAGDEFDAEGFIENYDVNGNLTTTRVVPSHARRCTMTMTLPQCIGVAPLTKSSP